MSDTKVTKLNLRPASSLSQEVREELARIGVDVRARRASEGKVRTHYTDRGQLEMRIELRNLEYGLSDLQAVLAWLRVDRVNYVASDATGAALVYEARPDEEWAFPERFDVEADYRERYERERASATQAVQRAAHTREEARDRNGQMQSERRARGPATPKQLRYLRVLAERTGTTFTPPGTSQEASRAIEQMLARQRSGRGEIARERREVSRDMAMRSGDAAQVTARELSGHGAHAGWASTAQEDDVVNCRRGEGSYDVYVGRLPAPADAPAAGSDGFWGNPFKEGRDGTRAEVVEKYERWLLTQPQMLRRLPELRGKRLGCWCAPKTCHADVLARLANGPLPVLPTTREQEAERARDPERGRAAEPTPPRDLGEGLGLG